MREVYRNFNADIAKIKIFLSELRVITSIPENRKLIAYDGALLNVFGCYEETVRTLIERGASLIVGNYPLYRDLPDKVIKAHRRNFAKIMEDTTHRQRRYFSEGLILEDEVRRFHSCENQEGGNQYELVIPAFSLTEWNINAEVLNNLIKGLGISEVWPKISNFRPLQKYFGTVNPGVTLSLAQTELDNLVQDRNAVAHGSDNHKGPDIIIKYSKFLRVLILALIDVLIREI